MHAQKPAPVTTVTCRDCRGAIPCVLGIPVYHSCYGPQKPVTTGPPLLPGPFGGRVAVRLTFRSWAYSRELDAYCAELVAYDEKATSAADALGRVSLTLTRESVERTRERGDLERYVQAQMQSAVLALLERLGEKDGAGG